MAMYEKEGYCPNNEFVHYPMENGPVPVLWDRTREILGDRTGYMVYTEAGNSYYGSSYVVDCLVGSTTTLGVEVACKLRDLIQKCVYAETGRKILVTDVINPFQMPGLSGNIDTGFIGSDKLFVLEDNRYVVGITDEEDAVHMYLFKKQ